MTQILKEGGKTIIKTDKRIDTMNAEQFEQDIEPVFSEPNIDLVMDCSELNYMASSGLRIIQKTMRKVMMSKSPTPASLTLLEMRLKLGMSSSP